MTFAVRLAWRETRTGWRHFVAVLACIALGVGALVAVGTLAANLERTLSREARSLLGGDVELRAARPLGAEANAALAAVRSRGATLVGVREMVAMGRDPRSGSSVAIELKAVDDDYPLYGRLETMPEAIQPRTLAGRGVLVQEELLTRLRLQVGDPIVIGAATFTVLGVVRREPDRPGALVRVGPRILLHAGDIERTGLIQPGSRVRYRVLVRLPAGLDPHAVRDGLARQITDPTVRLSAFDEGQPGLRAFFSQLTRYLGLVGLVSLLIASIGVATAVGTFLRRRLVSIAILRCLGASSRTLVGAYLLQTQALGLAGSLLGAGLGVLAQPVLPGLLGTVIPFPVESETDLATIARSIAVGAVMTLLAGLPPLLEVRGVPPWLVLKRDVEVAIWRPRRSWLSMVPILAGVAALAVWQAGSVTVGAIFLGSAGVALALLAAAARGLVRLAGRAPRLPKFAWRQGVAGLHRPGGHATAVTVSLGMGAMLLVATALLEQNLARHIDLERRRETPSFFFVDVQPDEREAFVQAVQAASNGVAPVLTPIIRARLAAIDGQPVTRQLIEQRRHRKPDRTWYFTRDYLLTYGADLPPTNVLTRGRWWTPTEAAAGPRVSVEEEAARYLGVDVGGRLTFDVQGVAVDAEVMSLRRVDWQSLSTNFFVILSPGALDGAPVTYVATVRVPARVEAAVQNGVAAALPTVVAVPVRDILERVGTILEHVARVVRVIALVSIAAGVVVMTGALVTTRYQRLYESVILRTLGATRSAVLRAFTVEYACLGMAAGVAGSLLAVVLAWVVVRFVLEIPWRLAPAPILLGAGATTVVALAVGSLATFRLLGQKPLAVLRQE